MTDVASETVASETPTSKTADSATAAADSAAAGGGSRQDKAVADSPAGNGTGSGASGNGARPGAAGGSGSSAGSGTGTGSAAKPATAVEPAAGSTAPFSATTAATGEQGILDRGREAAGRVGDAVDHVGEQVNGAVGRAGDAVERATAASGRVASAVVERLRNNAELAVERGITRIGDEVVEKIAGIAARDVPGVYDLGGDVARIFAAVKERIGLGDADDDADRGMSVRLEGNTAIVDITLVIEYGFVVQMVTEKVRAKVISAVENLLGLEVTEVNILVDDVHVPEGGPVAVA